MLFLIFIFLLFSDKMTGVVGKLFRTLYVIVHLIVLQWLSQTSQRGTNFASILATSIFTAMVRWTENGLHSWCSRTQQRNRFWIQLHIQKYRSLSFGS